MGPQQTQYGIIGYPLGHTLSPAMQNAAFNFLEVDASYEVFALPENKFDDFMMGLKREDNPIFGLNVTVPYKEDVLDYMDSLTPLAEKLRAVNTIFIGKKRNLIGHNTDAPGFLAHLSELNLETANKHVAILGAGGSTRAILGALCMIPERPRLITIYNRTYERLERLLGDLAKRLNLSIVQPVLSVEELQIPKADILINTTSVGLSVDDPCLVPDEDIHPNLFVYDLIYNPAKTALLQTAEAKRAKYSNGLGMLFYQGVLAFQHWAETEIDGAVKEIMRKTLEESLQKTL
ncbi:MAG: shikimate dehydrogenase [Candidatus Omnitrophica bacterium]|nr:shikimate dehydrogenase [Candidatus Omnitrophota bacterium]